MEVSEVELSLGLIDRADEVLYGLGMVIVGEQ